jgi:choline dehydrogenase-like flavoprotein
MPGVMPSSRANALTSTSVRSCASSAGAVLAAGLSEAPATRVLLVEAGPDYRSADAPPEMRGPNYSEVIQLGGYHWPAGGEVHRPVAAEPVCPRPGAGGSSAINAQGAMGGLPDDFDGWSRQGCEAGPDVRSWRTSYGSKTTWISATGPTIVGVAPSRSGAGRQRSGARSARPSGRRRWTSGTPGTTT